jgi:hypothetical protein
MVSTAIRLLATIVVMAQDHTSSMFQKNFRAGDFCFICISAQVASGIRGAVNGLTNYEGRPCWATLGSGIPIGLITAEVLNREIQESPYLGGQILPLGKDCIESVIRDMIGL